MLGRASMGDEAQTNESESESSDQSEGRLVLILTRASSLRESEVNAVNGLQQILCPSAIAEMVLHTTNPVVSDLALQSLAGIHHDGSPFKGKDLSMDLCSRLRSTFKDLFWGFGPLWRHPDSSTKIQSAQIPAYERLARAIVGLPDFSLNDWDRIQTFAGQQSFATIRHRDRIHMAALLGCPTQEVEQSSDEITAQSTLAAWEMQYTGTREPTALILSLVKDLPPLSLTKVNPWTYQHLRLSFVTAGNHFNQPCTQDEIEEALEALVKTLSAEHTPSLQDELRFLDLYAKYRRSRGCYLDHQSARTRRLLHFAAIDSFHPLAIDPSVRIIILCHEDSNS
jgi:hypothetical protein